MITSIQSTQRKEPIDCGKDGISTHDHRVFYDVVLITEFAFLSDAEKLVKYVISPDELQTIRDMRAMMETTAIQIKSGQRSTKEQIKVMDTGRKTIDKILKRAGIKDS